MNTNSGGKKMKIFEHRDTKIYNGDCLEVMKLLPEHGIDVILTSPPYNTTSSHQTDNLVNEDGTIRDTNFSIRYDVYVDKRTNEEYYDFTQELFENFDRILKPNGSILYNISYGIENIDCMFGAINRIITETNFTIADVLIWQKPTAIPNNVSSNKLTRYTEFVFVFSRKSEYSTFYCNKPVTSYRVGTSQPMYANISNIITAKNNDGPCPFNRATFSSELCEKLLDLYAPDVAVVYDPFMGTGTTAVACQRRFATCYGSELSENQCKWAIDRLEKEDNYVKMLDLI